MLVKFGLKFERFFVDLEVLSDIRSKFLSGKSESSDVSDVTWYFRS